MPINIPSTPFTLLTTNQLPPAPINTIAATTYTFQLSDGQAYVVFTAATTVTATIPLNTFPIGTQLTSEQGGAGSVVFAPDAGVTFNPTGSRGTLGQYSIVMFIQKSLNVWTCSGSFM